MSIRRLVNFYHSIIADVSQCIKYRIFKWTDIIWTKLNNVAGNLKIAPILNVNNKLHTGFNKLIIKNLIYPIVLKGQFLIELLNHAWRNLKQDHKVSVFIRGQQDHELGSLPAFIHGQQDYEVPVFLYVQQDYEVPVLIHGQQDYELSTCINSWTTGLRSTCILYVQQDYEVPVFLCVQQNYKVTVFLYVQQYYEVPVFL